MQVIGADSFAERLAALLGAEFVPIEKTVFPDFEVRPRFLRVDFHEHVILTERMKLPIDPNAHLAEIFLEIKTLKERGVKRIDLVMPYFIYSRQDKVFREGEPFSAKYIIELLVHAGVSNIFVVESHTRSDFGIVRSVSGFAAIGKYFFSIGAKDSVVIGPDEKARAGAEIVAGEIGGKVCVLQKKRDKSTGEIETSGTASVQGKNVIIIDDIISSGKTMLNAVHIAKGGGAKSIQCAVVHPITQQGIFSVSKEVDNFFACNTVDSEFSIIPVEGIIAGSIRETL